jgi:hypothetical protein
VPTSFCCGSTASASRLLLSADVFLRLNLVERFFAALTGDVIRAGSFASVKELFSDIKAYLAERNANPKPYKWKAEGAKILSKIKRARVALDKAKIIWFCSRPIWASVSCRKARCGRVALHACQSVGSTSAAPFPYTPSTGGNARRRLAHS